MQKEAPYVNAGREVASVMLLLLLMSAFAAAAIIIPPQLPIDEKVTIAPYGHHQYNRTMPTGRTVNIEIRVIEGAPAELGEVLLLSIMDTQNYNLRMNGSHTYVSLLSMGAYSQASAVWQVLTAGQFFFVIENPSAYNVTARIAIQYELEWLPALDAVIALCTVVIALVIVRHDVYSRQHAPQWIELRGDLDMIPHVVNHAPERINYVVITGPSLKKCAVCDAVIGEEDPVLRCPHCGSLAHKDHFLEALRSKGYCPACGKRLEERDAQPEG